MPTHRTLEALLAILSVHDVQIPAHNMKQPIAFSFALSLALCSCATTEKPAGVTLEERFVRYDLNKDGKIQRVAGNGKKGSGGVGGAPDQVELTRPHGATIDPTGAIVICDSDNNRVLRIEK